MMMSRRTLSLVLLATTFNAPLFGTLNRAIVDFAAWRKLGAVAWADYSRRADLGPGLVLYPVEAIGGIAFTLAALVNYYLDGRTPRSAAAPLYVAALGTVGGLLLTRQAAPKMLSLRRIAADDTASLQQVFDAFTFWSYLRLLAQAGAWLANLWSLITIATRDTTSRG
jgi:hypothetical protein